jgi:hypothetical protein
VTGQSEAGGDTGSASAPDTGGGDDVAQPIPDAGPGADTNAPPADAGYCLRVGKSATCGTAPQCGCPSNMTCDLTNSADTVCVGPAGIGTAGSLCANTGSCALGMTCLYRSTCHSFCATPGQPCGDAGKCIQLLDQNDAAVPNASLCEINCQLQDPGSCGNGGACYASLETPGATDCYLAGSGVLNAACTYANDCAAGLGCVSVGGAAAKCKKSCRVGNNADCGGQTCTGFNPKLVLNGQEYGSCP